METHSCRSLCCWLHLSDQSVSAWFSFLFLFLKQSANHLKSRVQVTEHALSSFFHACMSVHWSSPPNTERASRGCYVAEVHHSHLPVCQMSCLAELHTVMVLTKWQEGGTLQWMSIWLQSTVSPGALKLPHTKTQKGESCRFFSFFFF